MEKYFKYTYRVGPEDHTGRYFAEYALPNPDFIGPLCYMEYLEQEWSNIMAEEIEKEINKEILKTIFDYHK